MESVVYDGPQPSRTLELGPGKHITITKGEPFDVPADLAEQLLDQSHFSAAKRRSGGKKPSKLQQLKTQAAELGVEDADKLRTIKAAEAAIEAKIAEAETESNTPANAGQGGGEEGQV